MAGNRLSNPIRVLRMKAPVISVGDQRCSHHADTLYLHGVKTCWLKNLAQTKWLKTSPKKLCVVSGGADQAEMSRRPVRRLAANAGRSRSSSRGRNESSTELIVKTTPDDVTGDHVTLGHVMDESPVR